MPADSERRPPAPDLAAHVAALGARIAAWVLGGMLLALVVVVWIALDAEIRAPVHHLPAHHPGADGAAALRRLQRAGALAGERHRRRADRGQRLPQAVLRVVPGDRGVAAPRSPVGNPGPLRRHHDLADRGAGLRRRPGAPGGPRDPRGDRGEHPPSADRHSMSPARPVTRCRKTECRAGRAGPTIRA